MNKLLISCEIDHHWMVMNDLENDIKSFQYFLQAFYPAFMMLEQDRKVTCPSNLSKSSVKDGIILRSDGILIILRME